MRLAFLADIHGNLPALEVVAADLRGQGVDQVYLAGDQVNRVPWNNEVMDLIADAGWPAIVGNHDLVVGRILTPNNTPPFTNRDRFRSLWWTAATLAPRHLAVLRRLPAARRIALPGLPPIRLFHGVPENLFTGIYPETDDTAVQRRLDGVMEPVVVCAHTHRPLARTVAAWTIFNGGSVGLPYNGDTRAQYLILEAEKERGGWTWRPIFRQVDYDHGVLRPAYVTSGMMAATGAVGELHLLTAESGHPYSSDFGVWLHDQTDDVRADLDRAVPVYLAAHGPGTWAFAV